MDIELEIGQLLREKELSISVAESCTGGKVCDLITSVPGSSDYFTGGVIAYANSVKEELLSVNKEIIIKDGAVSKAVAEGMAEGIRKLMKTDIGISTTGIAGPSGGTEKKPVGMVVLGVDIRGDITTNIIYLSPPRHEIKEMASIKLLEELRNILEE